MVDACLAQAVELYRKAGRHTEAAKLLATLGEKAGKTKVDPLQAKKLYVLAAIEVSPSQSTDQQGQLDGAGIVIVCVARL